MVAPAGKLWIKDTKTPATTQKTDTKEEITRVD